MRKVKLTLRGVGIFPVKPNTNYTKTLYIRLGGLDDLIHDVVQKAISGGLLSEKELSHIHFDKQTDMYKTAQTHVTILKTKDGDIIDATEYMRQLNKLTILRPHFSDMRMSMLGSFDGERYYD